MAVFHRAHPKDVGNEKLAAGSKQNMSWTASDFTLKVYDIAGTKIWSRSTRGGAADCRTLWRQVPKTANSVYFVSVTGLGREVVSKMRITK